MIARLSIENFACIQKADIDFSKITILIGPQATGKSIIAKLLYFFKKLPNMFLDDGSEDTSKYNVDKNIIDTFEKYFPKKYFTNQSFVITHYVDDHYIKISNSFAKSKTGNIKLEYSSIYYHIRQDYKKRIRYLKAHSNEETDEGRTLFSEDPSAQARTEIISKYSHLIDFPIFIPAGRSFYSNIENIIFTLLSKNQGIDPFLQEFGSFYESIKRRTLPRVMPRRFLSPDIDLLKDAILRGDFYQDNGKDYIKYKDGRLIEMSNASSGQQEALPLYLALNWLNYIRPSTHRSRTVFIEEPEAHLFPDAQYLLVEAMGLIFNRFSNNLNFVITTHSPYILSTFNNLTYASTVINDNNREEASDFINTKAVITSNFLSAFSTSNKGVKKIICGETGLIDAEAIDSISNKISKQFDQLLDLENTK